jgi:ubiquinone biosynthesis protein
LLAEQRRTNRLLQAVLIGVAGFVVGAVVTQLMMRWHVGG